MISRFKDYYDVLIVVLDCNKLSFLRTFVGLGGVNTLSFLCSFSTVSALLRIKWDGVLARKLLGYLALGVDKPARLSWSEMVLVRIVIR